MELIVQHYDRVHEIDGRSFQLIEHQQSPGGDQDLIIVGSGRALEYFVVDRDGLLTSEGVIGLGRARVHDMKCIEIDWLGKDRWKVKIVPIKRSIAMERLVLREDQDIEVVVDQPAEFYQPLELYGGTSKPSADGPLVNFDPAKNEVVPD